MVTLNVTQLALHLKCYHMQLYSVDISGCLCYSGLTLVLAIRASNAV